VSGSRKSLIYKDFTSNPFRFKDREKFPAKSMIPLDQGEGGRVY